MSVVGRTCLGEPSRAVAHFGDDVIVFGTELQNVLCLWEEVYERHTKGKHLWVDKGQELGPIGEVLEPKQFTVP